MPKWLLIDTRSREAAVFGWLTARGHLALRSVRAGAPGLMSSLASRLKPSDVAGASGICVVRGPGSFSSIRMGTLVANLLTRLFNLKLYALDVQDTEDVRALAESLARRKPVKYAAPIYDRPPNITLAKGL